MQGEGKEGRGGRETRAAGVGGERDESHNGVNEPLDHLGVAEKHSCVY